jgi:hypothetical protein
MAVPGHHGTSTLLKRRGESCRRIGVFLVVRIQKLVETTDPTDPTDMADMDKIAGNPEHFGPFCRLCPLCINVSAHASKLRKLGIIHRFFPMRMH